MKIQIFDLYLGRFFFNNLIPLSYNLFNLIFKKFIANPRTDELRKFQDLGYFSLKDMDSNKLRIIQKEIEKQSKNITKNQTKYQFEINAVLKKIVNDYIDEEKKELFRDLSNYYKSNIFLSKVKLHRIYNHNNQKEEYANFLHYDQTIMTHFKIFININNVTEKRGPFSFYDVKKSVKFLKKNKFYERKKYNPMLETEFEDKIIKHIGKPGSSLICRSGECLHRASIPDKNNFRDLLCLVFVCSPYIKSNDKLFFYNTMKFDIWDSLDGQVTINLASLKGIKLVKNLIKYFTN